MLNHLVSVSKFCINTSLRLVIPIELKTDIAEFKTRWKSLAMFEWLRILPVDCFQGLSVHRYGDLPRWREVIANLPKIEVTNFQLAQSTVQINGQATEQQNSQLKRDLQQLHPWRKGPFAVFDIYIDTEWRSDW